MRTFYVYIAASLSRRLYIGVTNDLARRMLEHRQGRSDGFTKKYRINRLVHFDVFGDPASAIHAEKRLKSWPRARKIALIERHNAGWLDLMDSSLATERSEPSSESSLATERSEPSSESSLATERSEPSSESSLATERSEPSSESSLATERSEGAMGPTLRARTK